MKKSVSYIAVAQRCAIKKDEYLPNWWVAVSPRNGSGAAVEGSWQDWVALAEAILEADREGKVVA